MNLVCKFKLYFSSFLVLLSLLLSTYTSAANLTFQENVESNLNFLHGIYKDMYAPGEWKSKHNNWNIDEQLELAKAGIASNPNFNLQDSREILKKFIYSMKDYHVTIEFSSTEKASLPFIVRGANDKFFIVHIDRKKLSPSVFPFTAGDELVTFNGVSALQAVEGVQKEIPANVPATDRAMAERVLTNRIGKHGYKIPHGPIVVGIRAKGTTKVRNVQLIWEYTPERVRDPQTAQVPHSLPKLSFPCDKSNSLPLLSPKMAVDIKSLYNLEDPTPYTIGGRKSFVPDIGLKIWESKPTARFYAYIFKGSQNRSIGYVRIPDYDPDDSDYTASVKEFGELITMFEEKTDALVIDQVNNPGGALYYLYALAAMLSDEPLTTPTHRMSLDQNQVYDAYKTLTALQEIKNEIHVRLLFENGLKQGYPMSYQTILFTKNFLQFYIDEWNSGNMLTKPYWFQGIDRINPNLSKNYSKPILVLINELDFSGGDFLPAILQDNKRAVILGHRTAGAGGFISKITYPNNLGIAQISITRSIAQRADGTPIESLGVNPDVEYDITEEDLTNNYAPYVKKIKATLNTMLE